jgi:23S rRNA (cytosine1962-C5)-methyltransferase
MKRMKRRQPGRRRHHFSRAAGARPAKSFGAGRTLAVAAGEPLPAAYVSTAVRHPLIYRKRLLRVDAAAQPGDLVAVYVEPDELLGHGLYNPKSEIAMRMIRYGEDLPDVDFWQGLLQQAVDLRQEMLGLDEITDTYRVVHAEADRLPGLVIDKFGDVLSAEVFSLGMFQRAGAILELLAPHCGARHWMVQPGPHTLAQEGFEAKPVLSGDCPSNVVVQEFGTRFHVRFEGGHKTGFFCDQRENRRLLASYCPGRSVLDLCCYSGGFAVQAMQLGKAREATGVDLDAAPLTLAKENAKLNRVDVHFVQADAFPYMRDMLRNGRKFDVVILDPPKLIRSRKEIEEGTRKHFDLNRLAMQLVSPGGLLLSCSCAGLLSWEEFQRLLNAAARQAGPPEATPWPDGRPRHAPRNMQIIAKTGAGGDHPIDSVVTETEYLKAAWMRMG